MADRTGLAGTSDRRESVAFEWARDKDHPRFKAMSALMKEGQPSAD